MKLEDAKIICRLRNNSRENLTLMSRQTKIPISTIHNKLRKWDGNLIRKHTILLNYKNIGYDLRVNMLLKVPPHNLIEVKKYLTNNENVNSLCRVNNGFDLLVDILFRNMLELKEFTDALISFNVVTRQEYFILEDIKRESFMSNELLI